MIDASDFIAVLALVVSFVALLKSFESERENKLTDRVERIGRCMAQLLAMKRTTRILGRQYQSMASVSPSTDMADCLSRYAADCTKLGDDVGDAIENLKSLRAERRTSLEQRLSLSTVEQDATHLAQAVAALLADAEKLEVEILNVTSHADSRPRALDG